MHTVRMDADTERDPEEEYGIDQYWRRRAIALAGVLGVVGVAAWSCGVFGTGGGDAKKAPVQSLAGVAVPTPAAASGVPTPAPTVTVTKTAKAAAPSKTPRKDGDACDARDVVVNFASSGDTFAAGARPSFRLTVVNTGQRACGYDVGTGNLDIRITSGADKVWSASACDGGSGSSVQVLRRGIPYVTTVTWDRKRSGADCAGRRDKAMPGTYVAAVKADKVKPQKQVFHLR